MDDEVSEKPEIPRAQGTVIPKVSGFPIPLWKEWDFECKRDFGDCRWMKIWHDHLRAKDFQSYQFLVAKINELERKTDLLAKNKESISEVQNVTFAGR